MSDDVTSGPAPVSPARGITGQVAANASLLVAVLVYMGWAYDNALYGYFHLSPIDLNVGIVEYMLVSLTLFRPGLVVIAVGVAAVTAVGTWNLDRTKFVLSVASRAGAQASSVPAVWRLIPQSDSERAQAGRRLLIAAGAAITATAVTLASLASLVPTSTYVTLLLLGGGPLLLTWPTRADRHGRFPYSLAIVVAAVCALWAASLYASSTGTRAAQQFVHNLPSATSAVVYSAQPLALSGPGVTKTRLPAGSEYHYEYQGLRLLTIRSGTYYLLPVGWYRQFDLTYILTDSAQIRITLLSG